MGEGDGDVGEDGEGRAATALRGARGGQARPPASWPPRAPSRIDSSSHISQIFQKYSPSVFIPFGLRLIWGFYET